MDEKSKLLMSCYVAAHLIQPLQPTFNGSPAAFVFSTNSRLDPCSLSNSGTASAELHYHHHHHLLLCLFIHLRRIDYDQLYDYRARGSLEYHITIVRRVSRGPAHCYSAATVAIQL